MYKPTDMLTRMLLDIYICHFFLLTRYEIHTKTMK